MSKAEGTAPPSVDLATSNAAAMAQRAAKPCSPQEATELIWAGADWIWETDSDLKFSWLSDTYQSATGIRPEDVLGRFRFDFLNSIAKGSVRAAQHMDDLQARRPFRDFVYELRGAKDSCRWISISGFPRRDAAGTFIGYRGIARNVTGIVASARDLDVDGHVTASSPSPGGHSERMMAALNIMSDAFCYYDRDDRLVLFNDALLTMYEGLADIIRPGVAFAELLDTGLERNLWNMEGLTAAQWREAAFEARRKSPHSQSTLVFTDGRSVLHREVCTEDGGVMGICTDVTAMKSREADLANASAEARLLLSDLQRTIDAMSLGIVLLDSDLRAEIINKAFHDIWRVRPGTLKVGDPFRALIDVNRHNGIYAVADSEWEDYVASRVAEIRSGDVAPREFRRADGVTMIYSVTALSGGKRLVTYYDITELKERARLLAETDERARLAEAVIDAIRDPIFVKDEAMKFVYVNEAFSSLFGKAPAEMHGHTGGEFVSAEDGARFEETERQVLATGQAYEVEEDFEFAGIGRSRLVKKTRVEMDSGRRYVAGFIFDVSDIRRREKEAEEARQHLTNVLEHMPAAVVIYDRDENFVFGNKRLQSSLPALTPAWQPGKTMADALWLGHSLGYFRKCGDPEVDALYDVDLDRWLEAILSRYRQRNLSYERLNPDGHWYQVYDMRTDEGTFIGVRVDITQTKRSETEAESARKRLHDVLDSLPAGVIIYDSDNNFEFANKRHREGMPELAPVWQPGRTLREAAELTHRLGFFRETGNPAIDALYDADPTEWTNQYVAAHSQLRGQFERQQSNGRWTQGFNTRLEDGTFIGVRVDITELKGREKALHDSMSEIELYRQVLDDLPVSINIKSEQLKLEYVNKSWCALTGLAKSDAIGLTDAEIFGSEGEAYMADDRAVAQSGEGIETEESVFSRDGTARQVMTRKHRLTSAGGAMHLFGSSTDITEIKKRETLLKESLRDNEVFRSLIDNLPVAIYAKKPDLKLLYVNKGWCDLTGFSAADSIGRTDRDVFGADGEAFMEADREILSSGELREFEETVALPDGSLRHQFARKSAFVASDGTTYLIGSTIDVTEQTQREKDLREAQRQAVLADRAKSEFLANMSHEIRTPMNGVLGMAELLAKSDLNPKQRTFTEIIVKSGNALLTIINDILDFSKIDAGQLTLDPAPFNLSEAVEDVATLISTRAKEKDLELIVRVAPALQGLFVGDVGRIRQIVTNLIGNAVKFTEAGHVLIDVSGTVAEGQAALRIAVSDTGIGIPAEKLSLVFEKFSQVDASSTRRHEGTGLGLAITSRLVELMGGQIGVESMEGQGSTFWFTLSLPHAAKARERKVTPIDVTGARVLIVDDNAINRSILLEQMASWQFDACAAHSGAEGLKVLEAAAGFGIPVDCLVLDYQMPEMSGLEMAAKVRASSLFADLPIVMLTSVDQTLGSVSSRDLLLDAQLIKPARSSILLDALVAAIQRHRTRPADQDFIAPETAVRAVAPPEFAPATEPPAPKIIPVAQRLDVLVAEDNEVNQLVFTQILSETPLTFQIVGNGKLAVEAWREMHPAMILMDMSMPIMNGQEATAAIRAAEAATDGRTPIVGVTAHALKGDRERCIESGMDDYLPKPISPKALLEKIDRWMGQTDAGRREAASQA